MNEKKKISVGMGISKSDNAFEAAKEAATQALNKIEGKPTISFVYFCGEYDITQLNNGLKSILTDTEFVGGSSDSLAYETEVLSKGVIVCSLQSDYLHIGIGSADGVSKDPSKVTKNAINDALSKIKVDKYIDPYIQFLRVKKTNVKNLIKLPSYFVFVFSRGFKPNSLGNENIIIQSISNEIGLSCTIFGGSFGVPLENVFAGKPYEIYSLHSGKVMKDGIITVVFVSSLAYQHAIRNGAKPTKEVGYISKVEGNGFIVSGISGMDPIDWYCDKLKITRDEFVSKQGAYTQMFPLGIPDEYGSFTIRTGGVPYDNNTKLAFTLPFIEGNPVFLMDAKRDNLLETPDLIKKDYEYLGDQKLKPAITFGILCGSRRLCCREKTPDELKKLKSNIKSPIFGFYSFTEVGSGAGRPTKIQHMSTSIFTLYENLLTELK